MKPIVYTKTFKAKAEKIPEITVKVSTSIDGKQATDYGQSQWITNKTVKARCVSFKTQS